MRGFFQCETSNRALYGHFFATVLGLLGRGGEDIAASLKKGRGTYIILANKSFEYGRYIRSTVKISSLFASGTERVFLT